MLYEVRCAIAHFRAFFIVEATHGRVARGAGGVLARPPPRAGGALAGARALILSQPLIDQSIFSDWPPLYPLDWLSGGPTR